MPPQTYRPPMLTHPDAAPGTQQHAPYTVTHALCEFRLHPSEIISHEVVPKGGPLQMTTKAMIRASRPVHASCHATIRYAYSHKYFPP